MNRIGTIPALLALALPALAAPADDLEGSVRVEGRVVHIELKGPDGEPAPRVPVQLVTAKKRETLASGVTNAHGRWSHHTDGPGDYEILIAPKPGGKNPSGLPFRVRGEPVAPVTDASDKECCHPPKNAVEHEDEPAASRPIWPPLTIGGVLLGGAVMLFLFGTAKPPRNVHEPRP